MASITITVQSLLNTAVYDSYTIDNGQTVTQLKTAIDSARSFDSTWYDLVLNESVLSGASTLASLGITSGTALRTHNKISRLATRQLRQEAKLNLATLDRTASNNSRASYDITELPTYYVGDTVTDNPNVGGLIEGRPWISAPVYNIVTSGLRLYLDAGNATSYTSGTTWTDLSTNTNDATLVGSPAFTSAGTSSYFTFPNDTNKYATTSHTKYSGTYTGKSTFFVARMDASIADGYHGIFGVPVGGRTFNTYIYKTAGPNYQVHASFGGISSGLSDILILTANQWFTFGATQAANGDYTFYCNGQAVGITTGQTFTNTYSSSTNPQLIGKCDNFWHGDIAVVTVYDQALSGAEMLQNHNAMTDRYGF